MERLTLDDMIKALKCVASQDTIGDCYAGHENFMHRNDEHKRIVCGTGEDLRDYISGKEAVGCPYYQNTYGCCFENGELCWLKDVAELLKELKSYKDLEEQGLLVRLPCKVGTEVFCYFPGDSHYTKCQIKKIEICQSIFGNICYFAESVAQRGRCCRYYDNEFGKFLFLTREEAEKKLEDKKKWEEMLNNETRRSN